MDNLLHELVVLASQRGLSQSALAEKAGIHPVTLSRALTTGNCRLSTVQALAAFLGMKIIAVPDNRIAEGLAKGDLF